MPVDIPHPSPPLTELQEKLGYKFTDAAWLAKAITHRSFVAETPETSGKANQRLEFLGDAILGFITAEWLFKQFPDWQEGRLTKVRSRLTNAVFLATVAQQIELGAYLRLGRGEETGGGRCKTAVLADALEALFGALWLDGGRLAVEQVFLHLFAGHLQEAVAARSDINPKGDLQEWMQQRQLPVPRYEVLEEEGPAHCRTFRIGVYQDDMLLGQGEGHSKQEAEAAAAAQALQQLASWPDA